MKPTPVGIIEVETGSKGKLRMRKGALESGLPQPERRAGIRSRHHSIRSIREIRGLRSVIAGPTIGNRAGAKSSTHRRFPWLVGDLHERNIMRDANGTPTIINALVGAIR